MTSDDTKAIQTLIEACRRARDDRGRWRHVNRFRAELQSRGTSPTIARATAGAAYNLAVWLKDA